MGVFAMLGKTINFRYDQVVDDLGIGGKFPLPIGTYGNQIIGELNPYNLDKAQIKNADLMKLLEDSSEEDNSILVFYSTAIK